MRKLLRYKNGAEYIVTDHFSMKPAGVMPQSEIDLSEATDAEIVTLRKNTKHQLLQQIRNRSKKEK